MFRELLSGAKKKTVITAITLWTSNFCWSCKVWSSTPTHEYHGSFIEKQFLSHSWENNNYRYSKVFKEKKIMETPFSCCKTEFLKKLKPRPGLRFLISVSRCLKRTSVYVGEQIVHYSAGWPFSPSSSRVPQCFILFGSGPRALKTYCDGSHSLRLSQDGELSIGQMPGFNCSGLVAGIWNKTVWDQVLTYLTGTS